MGSSSSFGLVATLDITCIFCAFWELLENDVHKCEAIDNDILVIDSDWCFWKLEKHRRICTFSAFFLSG